MKKNIPLVSYPDALAHIVNTKKCIAISGSHGKSTTTAMTGVMLAGSSIGSSTLV
jgi:UDP-N-acetylmuramate--alanine ligase